MSHFKETPYFSGLPLVTVSNKVVKPQDQFPFRKMVGVDKDGETVRIFDLETEFENEYFVIFFLPMDFTVDSAEVCAFAETRTQFEAENCEVLYCTVH